MDTKLSSTIVLVVHSGGQDSTTCLVKAIAEHGRENVFAVSFDYGQRHGVEIESAMIIAEMAGITHEVIRCGGILKGTSPLVSSNTVEQYKDAASLPGGLEKTFVPMRNAMFLVLAANRAVVIASSLARKIDVVEIVTGVSQEDYGGYPDCRLSFIRTANEMIGEALDDPSLPSVYIQAPLIYLTKKQTVELSERYEGARSMLRYSHTCYNGAVPPCGRCHACLLRQKGYDEAGVIDPLMERFKAGDFPPDHPWHSMITQLYARGTGGNGITEGTGHITASAAELKASGVELGTRTGRISAGEERPNQGFDQPHHGHPREE